MDEKEYKMGGERSVKHEKSPISSLDQYVSQPATMISARDPRAIYLLSDFCDISIQSLPAK